MSRKTLVVFLLLVPSAAGGVFAGNVVYSGLDTVLHTSHAEAITLLQNEVKWVGGGADPEIAWTGFPAVGTELAAAGFTHLTHILSADLDTTSLSGFDLLFVDTCCNVGDGPNLVAAAGRILAFVNAGGGLIVEADAGDGTASWSWVPAASAIGHSGATDVSDDTAIITSPGHPVMAGLSNAGLSNWGQSIHSVFSTPAAAGFETLATNGEDVAALIAGQVMVGSAVPAVGAPGLVAFVLLLVALGWTLLGRSRVAG